MRIGSGYLGSSSLETSVANAEIIPTPPSSLKWTIGYKLYKFSFINTQACTVKINNDNIIYLQANQGLNIDQNDKEITNFCICEDNVNYTWVGAF